MAVINPGRDSIRTPRATKVVLQRSDFDQPNANGNIQLLEDTQYVMEGAVDVEGIAFETIQSSINTFKGSTTELQQIENCGGFIQNGGNLILEDMVFRSGTGQLLDVTGSVNQGPGPPLRGLLRIFSYNEFLRFDNLGTIDTMDRVLIEDSFFSNTAGPLTVGDVLLCDISHNRFDYLGLGPVTPQGFTWLRFTGSANQLIVQNNVFFLESGTFLKNGVYIHPTIEATIPQFNVAIVIEGNQVNNPSVAFFEEGDEDEITLISDNGDGTVTVSTSATHSLANDDEVNILRTEHYNGGYVVSNVVADTSFDITATYVDSPTHGTWHTGSIDQRDPRVVCRGNLGIANSRRIFFGFVTGNVVATDITVLDAWENVDVTGFDDVGTATERFALRSDGSNAIFVYQGTEMFKGEVAASLSVVTGTAADKDYEFAVAVNGSITTNVPVTTVTVGNDIVTLSILCAMSLDNGDDVEIQVRQVSGGIQDITVQDMSFLGIDSD